MAKRSPFEKAHYDKITLTKKTEKKIKRAYSTTAKGMKERLAFLKSQVGGNPSDALRQMYLKDLLKDLDRSISSLEKQVQADILSATEASGGLAIRASNEMMAQAGLGGLDKAFAYVPRQEMANILSGKLYGSDWSFSKAIWRAEKKTKEDLEKIVARGLAGNKPIYDIAKDLEKHVDPSARKPWDWGKVYPGTSKAVDYNAQRLARTMIQHSFQTSMVQAQRYNPFCKGIIWYSAGIHGRTCATCMERDGQVFPVKDLPLDHPNGLCYFEPALDDMNLIADRLADWTKGGSDPDLDNYVSKAFNFGVKTSEGQKAVAKAKAATGGRSRASSRVFDPEAWINGVKKNTEDYMLNMERKAFATLKGSHRAGLYHYTGGAYEQINRFLRKMGIGKANWGDGSIDGELERHIKNAMAGLRSVSTKKKLYLRRGSDFSDLASLMGGDFGSNMDMLEDLWDNIMMGTFGTKEEGIAYLSKQFEGTVGTFHGFTSTSSLWDRGFDGKVEYIFMAPKGTRGMSIMDISRYGTEEGEFLLNAGTRIKVHKILPSDGHFRSKIRVFLEIIV